MRAAALVECQAMWDETPGCRNRACPSRHLIRAAGAVSLAPGPHVLVSCSQLRVKKARARTCRKDKPPLSWSTPAPFPLPMLQPPADTPSRASSPSAGFVSVPQPSVVHCTHKSANERSPDHLHWLQELQPPALAHQVRLQRGGRVLFWNVADAFLQAHHPPRLNQTTGMDGEQVGCHPLKEYLC